MQPPPRADRKFSNGKSLSCIVNQDLAKAATARRLLTIKIYGIYVMAALFALQITPEKLLLAWWDTDSVIFSSLLLHRQ